MHCRILAGVLLALSAGLVLGQDEEKFASGPQAGKILPGPFEALNINGKKAKGRQHCLVCENGLYPVVMVFVKEPADGKDDLVNNFLAKLDEALKEHQEVYLGSFVVFLSPAARSSANNDKEEDSKKLVEEAEARETYLKKLAERADKVKNVVLACMPPEGPKDYKLNPKAEVTIVFYQKLKVLANWAYPEGKFGDEEIDKVMKTVNEVLGEGKKKEAPPEKGKEKKKEIDKG